ncbi:hypothetical protein KR222_000770, partial [Zaprionus bogoriensis]
QRIMHCAIYWICLLCIAWSGADPLWVDIANGRVQGRDNGGYYSYESIPYAEPPLGELRFEAPQPYSRQWAEPFDASRPPVLCLQWSLMLLNEPDMLQGNEDCLTVSVYRPKNESRQSFPVLVIIHGGAFMFGGAAEAGHEYLMSHGNLIVVKISYRLGPLGFLNTGDAHLPGNLGLKDQRLALKWIKANIASFGGEPENIVLIGHSAGGAAVHLQILHRDFNQLAKGAIAMSGNALDPWAVQKGGKQRAFQLGGLLGCGEATDSEALKKCLKSKDANDIVRAVQHFLVIGYVPFTPFGPTVEPADATDAFLLETPVDVIKRGEFATVPWLTTYTMEDGGFNAAMLLAKQSNGKELIEELNTRWIELAPDFLLYRHAMATAEELDNHSRELKQKYLGDRSFSIESYWDVQRMFTDVLFRDSVTEVIDLYREHGQSALYVYAYDNPAEIGLAHWLAKRNDVHFGTVHCDDTLLIYNATFRGTLRPDEEIISRNLIQMIEGFAACDQGLMAYDNCQLVNNLGQKKLQVTLIKRDGCENQELEVLP